MTKIGLEIHCQLTNLNSKLFCSCRANYRDYEINTNVCPVCLGLPGTLPRLNKMAVQKAIAIAKALECNIPQKIAFFRKHYFYPDLPKNFQIMQLNVYGDTSIGGNGRISIEDKDIRIRRIQIEEDPGRLIYEGESEETQIVLVDYNRSGTPLVEIVTEPDFENPRQVRIFLNILSDLLENLRVADPGLEGAMRADGNISIPGGSKVEIKNVNSFYDLEKALDYELIRQNSLKSRNMTIEQETRHWDDKRKITVPARRKVEDLDYRYFLEGDIPWIVIDSQTLEKIQAEMPESISSKKERYISDYGIAPQVAYVLSSDRFYSDLFEKAHTQENAKDVANMITTDIMGLVDTKEKRDTSKLSALHICELVDAIRQNKISRNSAKNALYELVKTGESVNDVMKRLDLEMSDSSNLHETIDAVMSQETKAAQEAKSNPQTINYLVGKVMKKSNGKADPKLTLKILKEKLDLQ